MRLGRIFWLLPALLRQTAAYTALSDTSLRSIPEPGSDFDIHEGALLAPLLRTRVPGTEGSQAALFHFVDFFNQNLRAWKITFQNSTQVTPLSNGQGVPFTNIIATRDPPWVQEDGNVGRLALVAHYDSKVAPEGFIGATDSAAPCAMLLHAARSIDAALTKKWAQMEAEGAGADDLEAHKGVQILLLDGEEAFVSWTSTDSLYGARALAQEWDETSYTFTSNYHSPLATIDLFVLLDLLGSENPKVPSYFKPTHWAYKNMAEVERRLRQLGSFKSSPNHISKRSDGMKYEMEPMFLHDAGKSDSDYWMGGLIEDDHVPFMARGVDILHIITNPFPRVWHTINDDGEHLHMDTVEDWALLTTAFAAEWLDLEGFLTDLPASVPISASQFDAVDESSDNVAATKRDLGEDEKSELYI